MTPRKKVAQKPLLSYQHTGSKRPNLPTDQTERYMTEEERTPVPYAPEVRGPEGPRLSWRRGEGLDDLTTKAGPLFVHEKVSPTAFAAQLRGEPAPALFDEFNGLPPEAAWSCYTHQGNWSNRIIKGDSRAVMASLAGKEDLSGKVQMIYWDPPYGISFKAGHQPSTKKRDGGAPAEAAMTTAFRDTYRHGVHSYLDAVYRTAVLGRGLLAESGSFFLQISSANLHRCALVLDEVFGPENRVATIAFAKTSGSSSRTLPEVADYLLWYSVDKSKLKYRRIYEILSRKDKIAHMGWNAMVELPDATERKLTDVERDEPDCQLPRGARLFDRCLLTSQGWSKTGRSEPYTWRGRTYPCPSNEHWRVSADGLDNLARKNRLVSSGKLLRFKMYESEIPGRRVHNIWSRAMSAKDMHYVVETAESVIERCILMTTDPGDLVLDPTCGSGTTAFVAEKWGRRWITIDASAIPVALCRQRIVSGVHDWFLTRDDAEGWKAEARLSSEEAAGPRPSPTSDHDPASGFVYERVPYVSAASLAYDHPPKATLLVDHPVTRRGWKRLAAPFTVESHSPWRYEPLTGGASETELRQGIRERVVESLGSAGFPVNQTNVGGGGTLAGIWMRSRAGLSTTVSSPTKPGSGKPETGWRCSSSPTTKRRPARCSTAPPRPLLPVRPSANSSWPPSNTRPTFPSVISAAGWSSSACARIAIWLSRN